MTNLGKVGMGIHCDNSRQLEAQLERLRQLVTDSGTGTLQARYVVAAQLHSQKGQPEKEGLRILLSNRRMII